MLYTDLMDDSYRLCHYLFKSLVNFFLCVILSLLSLSWHLWDHLQIVFIYSLIVIDIVYVSATHDLLSQIKVESIMSR